MSLPSSAPSLRVIVVGGGVAGLTASHVLQKANIDHVVLERGAVAPAEGASIAIYPHGLRILAQIGAFEAAKKACVPMDRWKSRAPNGKEIADNGFFHHVRENHGHDILLLERREFLQILYDTLPDKSFIKTSRKVVDIIESPGGVEAYLSDGSIELGDVVLGCDGVNSRVRELMWDRANKVDPGTIIVKDKTSVKTSWKALVGMSSKTPGLGENDMSVVHNGGYSFLALTQPDKVFWFVFFKLSQPSSWPRRVRFSDGEAAELAESIADHPISDTMVFGELWRRRTRATLIPIEEGVLSRWWYGRTVLAGDAAHKVTPNIALGGNSTMESVVVFCNHLRKLVQHQRGARPSRAKLNKVFAEYQKEREARMRQIMDYSSMITKFQAWDSTLFKIAATWIAPYLPDRMIADDLGRIIREAPKLNFVDVPTTFAHGSVPWADEEISEAAPLSTAPEAATLGQNLLTQETEEVKGKRMGDGRSSLFQLMGAFGGLLSVFYFLLSVR